MRQAQAYEFEIGARIQKALLLGSPQNVIDGIELSASSIPSQMIDGDFYDFYSFDDSTIDVVVGDVMGKGVPAALLGAAAKTNIIRSRLDQTLIDRKRPEITTLLNQVDHYLTRQMIELNNFLTLIYLRVNLDEHSLDFVDCGHTSIIHVSTSRGLCHRLKGADMPIGFMEHQNYHHFRVPLEENDLIFLYSDGITEVENSEKELFGEERLEYLIKSVMDRPVEEVVQKVQNIAFNYSTEGFSDDVTCIALRVNKFTRECWKELTRYHVNNELFVHVRTYLDSVIPEGWGVEKKEGIILAVHEALTNISEHGINSSQNRDKCIIFIEVGIYSSWFSITMDYSGMEYDWMRVEEPDITQYQIGGYGLYLIKEIMESVHFSRSDKGQCRLCLSGFI